MAKIISKRISRLKIGVIISSFGESKFERNIQAAQKCLWNGAFRFCRRVKNNFLAFFAVFYAYPILTSV